MAKDFGLSCPLCLTANDPAHMLGVTIEHAVPVPSALIGLCKRCVLAIVKSAMAAEFLMPQEVFGDAGVGIDSAGDAGPGPADSAAADPLVPEAQSHDEGAGEHRQEPEMPAGGERAARSKRRSHEA